MKSRTLYIEQIAPSCGSDQKLFGDLYGESVEMSVEMSTEMSEKFGPSFWSLLAYDLLSGSNLEKYFCETSAERKALDYAIDQATPIITQGFNAVNALLGNRKMLFGLRSPERDKNGEIMVQSIGKYLEITEAARLAYQRAAARSFAEKYINGGV